MLLTHSLSFPSCSVQLEVQHYRSRWDMQSLQVEQLLMPHKPKNVVLDGIKIFAFVDFGLFIFVSKFFGFFFLQLWQPQWHIHHRPAARIQSSFLWINLSYHLPKNPFRLATYLRIYTLMRHPGSFSAISSYFKGAVQSTFVSWASAETEEAQPSQVLQAPM